LQAGEFGYSRKDIILLGVGLIGLGYAMYYGLQVRLWRGGVAAVRRSLGGSCLALWCMHATDPGPALLPSAVASAHGAREWFRYAQDRTGNRASASLSHADQRTRRPLQAFGVDPLFAGNVVQLTIVLGISLGYISTYVFRVANKVRRTAPCSSACCSP